MEGNPEPSLDAAAMSLLTTVGRLAFKYCRSCIKRDASTFEVNTSAVLLKCSNLASGQVECDLCGWRGNTNPSRFIHRHTLRQEEVNGTKLYGKFCKPVDELRESHAAFVRDCEAQLAKLRNKQKRKQLASGVCIWGCY